MKNSPRVIAGMTRTPLHRHAVAGVAKQSGAFASGVLRVITFAMTITVAILLLVSCNKFSDSELEKNNTRGATVIETGTLEAINNVLFVLPRYSMYLGEMRIIGIVENGFMVNEGDSIIQIDPSDVYRLILDRETNLETQRANLEKLLVTQSSQISEQESKIRNESAAYDLKKIEMESARFETERRRTILQLEFQQAELNLAKEKRKLELAKIVNINDLKIQQVRLRQIENELEQFYQIIPKLTVRSSVAGVFQRGRNPRNGQPFNAGDLAIPYPYYPMGNVPELKWMKVTTFINENDYLKVKTGQQVTVRLDALPELAFTGEVASISRLCRTKEANSRQKGFDVEVKMLEPDERMKPGMTVSCEFLSAN